MGSMSKAGMGGAEAREVGAWNVPGRRRLEAAEQGLTVDWNTMCRRQRVSQRVRVGITGELAGGRCVSAA
jgi:hypothetical protein